MVIVMAAGLAAAIVALFVLVPGPAIVAARPRPVLKVTRPAPGHDALLSPSRGVRVLSDGYPDGKGQGLFWVYQSDSPSTWQLLRLPEGKILAVASGFDQVLWTTGGVASGEISVRKPGSQFFALLSRVPILGRARFIAAPRGSRRELEFYAIDTRSLTITPLAAAKRPFVRYTRGSTMFEDPSLAETRRRGDVVVACGRGLEKGAREATQYVRLIDNRSGTIRTLLESSDADISDPFFTDDDTVMFKRDNGVWRVKISTSKAQQVLPAFVESTAERNGK